MGEECADLLELAGVDTLPARSRRNAENLRRKLVTRPPPRPPRT
jgi:hypothetical protein